MTGVQTCALPIYILSFNPDADFFEVRNTIHDQKFAVSEAQFDEKWENTEIKLLFSGSLIKRKGIDYLQEAYLELITEDTKLRETSRLNILGAGDDKIIDNPSINHPGYIESDEYSDYVKNFHIFVLPSLYDCNPLTAIEAVFGGIVLLLSDGVCNYPELLHGNGLLFKAGDKEDLKIKLKELLSTKRDVLKTMAENSLKVSKVFKTSNNAANFVKAVV